jgi:amino acid transporter
MASDGLLFRQFDYVLPRLKTPLIACIATGLLSGFLVLMFDLSQLIDMMSFGTLLAYSLVSMCTLVLRYRPDVVADEDVESTGSDVVTRRKTWVGFIFGDSNEPLWKRIFMPTSTKASKATSHLVSVLAIFTGI